MLLQAQDMFQQGLDIAHEDVLRVLEVMWMKFLDDASHYNHITGTHPAVVFIVAIALCLI